MLYHYGRPAVCDFTELLGRYSPWEFAEITRSTVPLLFYWSGRQRVGNLLEHLNVGIRAR